MEFRRVLFRSPHSWDNASSNSHDANQAPPMLRLTELTLPIEHPPEALAPAIQQRLRLPDGALLGFPVFKRSYDARKKYADLSFVYTVACELRDEAAVPAQFEQLGSARCGER